MKRIKSVEIDPQANFVVKPLMILFEDELGRLHCHIHPADYPAEMYGIALADAARHIAELFKVSPDIVFEIIEKERRNPTSDFSGGLQ